MAAGAKWKKSVQQNPPRVKRLRPQAANPARERFDGLGKAPKTSTPPLP